MFARLVAVGEKGQRRAVRVSVNQFVDVLVGKEFQD